MRCKWFQIARLHRKNNTTVNALLFEYFQLPQQQRQITACINGSKADFIIFVTRADLPFEFSRLPPNFSIGSATGVKPGLPNRKNA